MSITQKQLTDAECVEELRAALASLDEAIGQWKAGQLDFQPSRQFGAETLRGVLREVDRYRIALERISRFETDRGPVAEDDRGGAPAAFASRVLADLTSVAV